ncbi:MerR family transcriptional regulator [Clostridium sp. PL3]|uniref:MerR family transcriptional regulator n=1 Tax=Clostridium thailandense TaxID=2794346 RepID=A0A949TSF6_9CLOT|nr:MerR family transcriptional regulator [Clostridium thailandense]MBV7272501.1 MerR family transcriptional regulator [Clostridium thailandense]
MEYTVQKLANLAGVSTRTLRYYDEIGLLKPARISSSGYRIYGKNEIDKLQLILFYRELGINLESIQDIITSSSFERSKALKEHHQKLLGKRKQLDLLIANVDKTIKSIEGGITMSDREKFEGFKKKLIDDNEKKYGKEIREKYGEEAVNISNSKIKNMTQEEYARVTRIEKDMFEALETAFETGDAASELAKKAADLHRQWISFYWDTYTKEAHAGVARMYVDDERFKAYYDKEKPGIAEFLRDAILIYTGIKL